MNNINKTYRRDKNHNYLILSLAEEEEEPQYQIEMIRENNIAGLLPCEVVTVDGKYEYRYEITSRQQMDRVFEKKDLSGDDIIQFIEGFKTVLNEIEKYLLDADTLIIQPEFIYMDVEKRIPVFCCLPCYKGKFKEEFREFAKYLLKKLNHRDVSAVSMGYNIYRVTLDENYDMAAVFNLQFRQENNHSDQKPVQHREWDDKIVKGYMDKGADEESAGAVPMPELADKDDPVSMNDKNRDIRNGNKKHGPKKKTYIRGIKDKKYSSDQNKKNSTHKTRKKQSGFNIYKTLVVIAGTGLAGGILGLAAWFGELNLTQLGGLLFLILGLLIYFTSVWTGPKKKEKKKEYTENAGYGLMIEYEESIAQPAEPGQENVQGCTAQGNQTAAGMTGKLPENQHNSMENNEDDIFEEYSESKNDDENKYFGETILLNEKEEEGFSYCLIPQNSDDTREIWLAQKNIMVGKLRHQADILIEHSSVSRVHARLVREGEIYSLADLNSTNGTYLNGQRLSPDEICPLKDGDEIRFAVLSFLLVKRAV